MVRQQRDSTPNYSFLAPQQKAGFAGFLAEVHLAKLLAASRRGVEIWQPHPAALQMRLAQQITLPSDFLTAAVTRPAVTAHRARLKKAHPAMPNFAAGNRIGIAA
ncbi:MAG: hypothetical protein CBB71_20775 [Rhodopirellula sp. TMED11]|nr:MAG: hypothetical protein CBB71_20775 [Rhodopirellula sp. TMED11]